MRRLWYGSESQIVRSESYQRNAYVWNSAVYSGRSVFKGPCLRILAFENFPYFIAIVKWLPASFIKMSKHVLKIPGA